LEERLGALLSGLFSEETNIKQDPRRLVEETIDLAKKMATGKFLFLYHLRVIGGSLTIK
jgi:hypothetical protein